jgi:hypothetical protein
MRTPTGADKTVLEKVTLSNRESIHFDDNTRIPLPFINVTLESPIDGDVPGVVVCNAVAALLLDAGPALGALADAATAPSAAPSIPPDVAPKHITSLITGQIHRLIPDPFSRYW